MKLSILPRVILRAGLALVLIAGLTYVATAARPSAPAGKPNLTVDRDRVVASCYFEVQTFAADDCAVQEGCLGPMDYKPDDNPDTENFSDDGVPGGPRRLMRFDVAIQNRGTADAVLGPPPPIPTGPPPVNLEYEYSQCHGHWHFKNFVEYTMFEVVGGMRGEKVAAGRKQAFCLEDFERIPSFKGAGKWKYRCSDQGITVGWQDVYRAHLDCQWMDVSQLAPGEYELWVAVDVVEKFAELREDDNVAKVRITIPAHDLAAEVVAESGKSEKGCCGAD